MMTRMLLPIALLALSVSACAREPQPATSTASAPAASAASDVAQEVSAAPSSDAHAGHEEHEDHAMHLAAADQAATQPSASSGRWQQGTHYKPVQPAQQTSVNTPGNIEVLEFFWYGCGHCYALEPHLESWKKKRPAYVEFVKVPVTWGVGHQAHARLFYALETLGRADLHKKVFESIHQQHNALAARDPNQTLQMQTAFASANGISAADFRQAYNSFSVNASVERAKQLTQRYGIDGVPNIIINGKYKTDVSMAGGQTQLITLINDLAATEKSRVAASASR